MGVGKRVRLSPPKKIIPSGGCPSEAQCPAEIARFDEQTYRTRADVAAKTLLGRTAYSSGAVQGGQLRQSHFEIFG